MYRNELTRGCFGSLGSQRKGGLWRHVQRVRAGQAPAAHWSPGCKFHGVPESLEVHAWEGRSEGRERLGVLLEKESAKKAKTWPSFYLTYFLGLKTMVSLGVKNPLLDLTALEDKPLDEVSDSKGFTRENSLFLVFNMFIVLMLPLVRMFQLWECKSDKILLLGVIYHHCFSVVLFAIKIALENKFLYELLKFKKKNFLKRIF